MFQFVFLRQTIFISAKVVTKNTCTSYSINICFNYDKKVATFSHKKYLYSINVCLNEDKKLLHFHKNIFVVQ